MGISSLFDDTVFPVGRTEKMGSDAWILRAFALAHELALWQALETVLNLAPLRRMKTPGGKMMSAEQTNCGQWGWVTDRAGYRYVHRDPLTGQVWPEMPSLFQDIAQEAAQAAGYDKFHPDACLINCYGPGARMGLHQDKDETDLGAPIVSVSLGLTTQFLFGGLRRTDMVQKILLVHGDVLVWGGQDRLRFHGVAAPLKGEHLLCGNRRFNLTFRQAKG
jgi:alkylated DNA repair protein (DNA oxidative demethylase)